MEQTDYTIVIPVYCNAGCLGPVLKELDEEVLRQLPAMRPEIIFVDDGSPDGSLAELLLLREECGHPVKIVKLTRNFGQANALMAGLAMAQGSYVVIMSADGQDPPAMVREMILTHVNERVDVVVCTRRSRDESAYRRITSWLFYALMRKLTFPQMPAGGFDFLSMSRRALSVVLTSKGAHPFLQGHVLFSGYSTKFLGYDRRKRIAGQSRWTLSKKITYLLDGVVGFSFAPIRLMSLVGALVALGGLAYALLIFGARILGDVPFKGWAPIMVVALVLGGIQLLTLGIIGEYVWRILDQVRDRPNFVIDRIWE